MTKVSDILSRDEASEFGSWEAAALLGVGDRIVRRWCQRYEEDEVEALYRDRSKGFTARYVHEHLVKDQGFRWG